MAETLQMTFYLLTEGPAPEDVILILASNDDITAGFCHGGEFFDLNGPYGIAPFENAEKWSMLPDFEEFQQLVSS